MRNLIQINDTFRLRYHKGQWSTQFWLEEWKPTERIRGRWRPITKRLYADSMDQMLERMRCPAKAHDEFRALP